MAAATATDPVVRHESALDEAAIDSLRELQALLAAHLAQPRFAAATWGVKVISLNTGATLFEHNAGKLLKPASNAKLYTGALALDRFGASHRLRTSISARRRPDRHGTLAGDLILYGRGDPSFAARFHAGDYAQSLQPLVQAVVAAGIQRIDGDLVGDESYFQGPPLGTGWAWDDLQYYFGAEVSALSVDDNTVDLFLSAGSQLGAACRIVAGPATPVLEFINRTTTVSRDSESNRWIQVYRPLGENTVELTGRLPLGETNCQDAVTVHQPARWFLARFQEALDQRGIRVTGQRRIVGLQDRPAGRSEDSPLVELGYAESRTMGELVERMMKDSQNLYAQLLLLQAGVQFGATGARCRTTEEAGLAALREFLSRAGVAPGEVLLEEGAGLSHGSAVTPNATVTVLQHMSRHREATNFFQSLPLAGVEGTLRRRLAGTATAGRVRAKPGALRHASTLSGYVTLLRGERLAFSIMLNQYQPPEGFPAASAEVDRLVHLLARFKGS